jgi:hypothetical protein
MPALSWPVLQGVQPEEGQARNVESRRIDAEDATAVVETIVVHNARFGQASRSGSDS